MGSNGPITWNYTVLSQYWQGKEGGEGIVDCILVGGTADWVCFAYLGVEKPARRQQYGGLGSFRIIRRGEAGGMATVGKLGSFR